MKGYGLRKRKTLFIKLLKIALIALLSIGAIKIGTMEVSRLPKKFFFSQKNCVIIIS
ncbi:MAG TPA: hypothetical protein PLH43_06525 [Acetivibrio sp.]|uniref:hypothetical protein n=1 Tax=Acetivibrio sp. TaxID=1872092 RepID=UPI002C29177D|nr:hypothetical protein [Acetivibrio sp.]HOM02466.1 hypothetical protein [Acetivibrio sp.]